jgi:hypothetical protein
LHTTLVTRTTVDGSHAVGRDGNNVVLEEVDVFNTPTEALGLVLGVGGGGQEG